MGEQPKKPHISAGLLAHVDAGKTTLSEGLLYCSGSRRTLGRVDHQDAFLDTHDLERARGITIFSKQALLSTPHRAVTLVDTPGHVDFSAEAERVLPVLDCAVLVISGTDGIQAHTRTLWSLLERYQVPTFLFINKMDLPGADPDGLMTALERELGTGFVDFTRDTPEALEAAALCDEALLESFLHTGTVTDGNLQGLITHRKLFPCCFGSALKLEGVARLLDLLDRLAPESPRPSDFGARVYKISRDPQGNRLTWLKVTGGSLRVRSTLSYTGPDGQALREKVTALRLYSGEKFTSTEEVPAGCLCAVTGLGATFAGQGLGWEPPGKPPITEPVMTYRLLLPPEKDPARMLPLLRQLEEDPQLHLLWDDGLKQIHVQIMGKIQLQVLSSLIRQRFDMDVTFADPRIFYKETILGPVEGVGHFEPLRHYAEVHLFLEPLAPGTGLIFATSCPTDVLDINYQHLVLTHLEEKLHRGVLVGAPITDMKITLLAGRAHLKHTEGGDFRQATYRAVRQGLMQAKSQLLEPWYRFTLRVPAPQLGRAITDIRAMGGKPGAPENHGDLAVVSGLVPAGELQDYAEQVAAYTQGRGQLQMAMSGYAPCHNPQTVIEAAGYDPEADLPNTPNSVFCSHGAGFTVKWDRVKDYMHLKSGLEEEAPPTIITRNIPMDDRELEAIMEREFGPQKTQLYRPPANRPATEEIVIRPPKTTCLIMDGYNLLFAREELAQTAKTDLIIARRQLLDLLSSYASYKKYRVIVVFDGYRVAGNPGEKSTFSGLQVVYTKENETADAYIEGLAHQIGTNYAVRVVTSDALVQLSSLGSGVLRMSSRELWADLEAAQGEMRRHFSK